MKKIITVAVFLCIALAGFAQRDIIKLGTDADVLKFVQRFYRDDRENDWKSFQFIDGAEWKNYYNLSKTDQDKIASEAHYLKWVVRDVNSDGLVDLVVSGRLPNPDIDLSGEEYKLLVFLSHTDGSYDVRNLTPFQQAAYPFYFDTLRVGYKQVVGGVTGLKVTSWAINLNAGHPDTHPFTEDTLVFANDYFINYNETPDSGRITKVEYTSRTPAGDYAHLVMTGFTANDVAAQFRVSLYNGKDSTKFRGRATVDIYSELLALVNYAGFMELPEHFTTQNTGTSAVYTLKITYADGSEKMITDNGGYGSYTLSAIYSWLEDLIEYADSRVQNRNRPVQGSPFDNWDF